MVDNSHHLIINRTISIWVIIIPAAQTPQIIGCFHRAALKALYQCQSVHVILLYSVVYDQKLFTVNWLLTTSEIWPVRLESASFATRSYLNFHLYKKTWMVVCISTQTKKIIHIVKSCEKIITVPTIVFTSTGKNSNISISPKFSYPRASLLTFLTSAPEKLFVKNW